MTNGVYHMKKIFISIIALQRKGQLHKGIYKTDNSLRTYPEKNSFPILTSMYNNIEKDDSVEIISVIMNEDSEANYSTFLEEFETLKKNLGFPFKVQHKIIRTSTEETQECNVKFFENIIQSYSQNAKIYMDTSYGQKPKSTALFSSLLYAEKAKGCSIESVVYGGRDFSTAEGMSISDITFMYTMNSIIATALENGNEDIKGIIDLLMSI